MIPSVIFRDRIISKQNKRCFYYFPVNSNENELEALPSVPYEINANDEKFLREATKLIGTSLSDLDICHHRVILKLRKSCHELNAEQLGKLSVMLLNCQSYSEGRSMYECTENMVRTSCLYSSNDHFYIKFCTLFVLSFNA